MNNNAAAATPLTDIHVDDFAHFVFVGNRNNTSFVLNLPGIETSKDLFFFLLDLLCKGLVILYGKGQSAIDLMSIDLDQFRYVCGKLACAGIVVVMRSEDLEESYGSGNNPSPQTRINMPQLLSMPETVPLRDFVLEIQIVSNTTTDVVTSSGEGGGIVAIKYFVSFELTHNC